MSQFECPRCQAHFSGDANSSFADCPECGSLALPFGDGGPAPAIHKAPTPEQLAELRGDVELASLPDGPAFLPENSAEDVQGGSGIFNALLEDTPLEQDLPGLSALEATPSLSFGNQIPNTLLGGEFGALAEADSASGLSPFVGEQDAAQSSAQRTDESIKTRSEQWDGLSFDTQHIPSSGGNVFDEATVDNGMSSQKEPTDSFSDNSDSSENEWTAAHESPPLGGNVLAAISDLEGASVEQQDFSKINSVENSAGASIVLQDLSDEVLVEQDLSQEQYAADETAFGGDDAAFFSQEASDEEAAQLLVGQGAGGVLLKDLEGGHSDFRLDGGDASDLFSGANFDALEAAFDEAAASPDVELAPTAENALLQSSEQSFQSFADEGLASMEMEIPHAPRLRSIGKELHLSLRSETLALATYGRDEDHTDDSEFSDAAEKEHDSLKGLRTLAMDGHSLDGVRENAEKTDLVSRKAFVENDNERQAAEGAKKKRARGAAQSADAYDVSQLPSPWSTLPMLRIAVLLGLGLFLGVGVGVLSAPREVKKPTSARSRAEQKIALGNKAYAEGRFDDALGEFRGAISLDHQYALAYRAKGSAFAKEKRFKDASKAYRRYLEIAVDPIDKEEVIEILDRYLGSGWKK